MRLVLGGFSTVEDMESLVLDQRELARAIKFAIRYTDELSLSELGPGKGAALDGLAKQLGRELGRALEPRSLRENVYAALESFWRAGSLGQIEVTEGRPTLVKLSKCFQCHALKGGDPRLACAFKRVLLGSALESFVPDLARVEEERCCRNGGRNCVFSVVVGPEQSRQEHEAARRVDRRRDDREVLRIRPEER